MVMLGSTPRLSTKKEIDMLLDILLGALVVFVILIMVMVLFVLGFLCLLLYKEWKSYL